jgi:membrane protein YqaA with SNARE-associated domain
VSRCAAEIRRSTLWTRIAILAGLCGGSAVVFWLLPDEKRGLLWLALYAVPAHVLVSPLPYEPLLLHCAKTNALWQVVLAACSGCAMTGLIDYWLLVPFFEKQTVRKHVEGVRLFRRSSDWFRRAPFLVLALTSMAPVPSEPFKFLSIVIRYPMWKYIVAVVLGRAPKYLVLAYLGYVLQPPTWLIVALCGLMLIPFVWNHLRSAVTVAEGLAEDPKPMQRIVPAQEDHEANEPPREAVVQPS